MPQNYITLPDGTTRPLNFSPSPPQPSDHVWHPPMGIAPFGLGPGPFLNEQYCPPTDDQGQQGSCTADGGCGLYEFTGKARGQTVTDLSRAFLYYHSRVEDGQDPRNDTGSYPRTVAKVLNQRGVARERLMPYNPSRWDIAPSQQAEADAANFQLLQYARPQQNQSAMTAMFSLKQGMIGGFPIYQSFESAQAMQTGIIPVPQQGERLLGYHLTFFYDCDASYVHFQNSWGTGIGVNGSGRFRMPWQLVLNPNFFTDIWTFITVEEEIVPQPVPPTPDEKAKLYADILRILGPIDGVGIHFQFGDNWPLGIQPPPS